MRKLIEGIVGMLASFGIAYRPASIIWYYNIIWPRLLNHEAEGEELSLAFSAPIEPSVWHYLLLIAAIVLFVFSVRNFIAGLKQVWIDTKTHFKGCECVGVVAETKSIYGNSNGSPFQIAHVGVLFPDNSIGHFHSVLRLGEQYEVGDFVYVKYYDNDINIIRLIESNEVSMDAARILKYYPRFWSSGYVGDYFINGHAIAGISTIKINDKRYNVQFDYDKAIDEGFYEGDAGAYYKREDE